MLFFFFQAGERIAWGLKPLTAVIGVVFISMGIYLNLPALLRVDWRTLVAALLVPLVGYSLGASAAAIFKQDKEKIITISLETGFQNFSLSLMVLASSLESPDSEMASVVPVVYTFLSAALPAIVFLVVQARRFIRWAHKRCTGGDVKPDVRDDVIDIDMNSKSNLKEVKENGTKLNGEAGYENPPGYDAVAMETKTSKDKDKSGDLKDSADERTVVRL